MCRHFAPPKPLGDLSIRAVSHTGLFSSHLASRRSLPLVKPTFADNTCFNKERLQEVSTLPYVMMSSAAELDGAACVSDWLEKSRLF